MEFRRAGQFRTSNNKRHQRQYQQSAEHLSASLLSGA
jgi:ribosomal protein L32